MSSSTPATNQNNDSGAAANVDLSGRIALVTGASRGIGAAIAKAYAKAGAHVVMMARTVGALEEVDDEIRAAGGTATLIPSNLLDLEKLDSLGPQLAERFGKLDIFVANAGLLGTLGPMTHMKANEWEDVINVNVNANFRLLRTLEPLLQASDAGRIIFVSSGVTNDQHRSYWGAYTASKAALEAMAYTYASETAKTNVKVNIVDPGRVRTSMRASAYPGEDPKTLPTPEEIMPTFLKLACPTFEESGKRFRAS